MDHDESVKKLIPYIAASTEALPILSQWHGMALQAIDVQKALCSVLEIEETEPARLLERDLTRDVIVELLREFDFKQYHPEVIFEFHLESGNKIIPEKIPFLLSKNSVAAQSEIWRVYKIDPRNVVDAWPANPHARNQDTGLRLHLGSGELFDADGKRVEKIPEKKLLAIRGGLGDIALPELT